MKLNTADKFMLLIMHPRKSRCLASRPMINAGLSGSILLDLSLENKIGVQNQHLMVKDPITGLSDTHGIILKKLSRHEKKRKIKSLIARLSRRNRKYRYGILHDLESKELVAIEDKKFLIFTYKKAKLTGREERENLIRETEAAIIGAVAGYSVAAAASAGK